jgi:hypothetical protein
MEDSDKIHDIVTRSSADASGAESGSTLLPMLIGGLVLIVIGAVIVMAFV